MQFEVGDIVRFIETHPFPYRLKEDFYGYWGVVMRGIYENYVLVQWINRCDWNIHPLRMNISDLRKIDKHEFAMLQLRYLHDQDI